MSRRHPGRGRSRSAASARSEHMSHGLRLQPGKCSVQKAPRLAMAWEQQCFQTARTTATGWSALRHLLGIVTAPPGQDEATRPEDGTAPRWGLPGEQHGATCLGRAPLLTAASAAPPAHGSPEWMPTCFIFTQNKKSPSWLTDKT